MFNENTVIGGLIVLSLFALITAGVLLYKFITYRKRYNEQLRRNITDDLEIATTDQLFKELNKRPSIPWLILKPISEEDKSGLSIECHNMSPETTLATLHFATSVTFREFKLRGIPLPELPSYDDLKEGGGYEIE